MSDPTETLESKTDLNNSEETNTKKMSADSTPSATSGDIPDFGWSSYAERMNGRFAMIGFTAVLLIELLSNKAFLDWAGFIN